MSPDLPSGTVTFLFTDIEGSTRLLRELGDNYADVLAEHRRVLREAFRAHGGVEVDTQGDAFFVAFARASDALLAAEAAQSALDRGPVRVRMGIHTGEPQATEEGYVGMDVHRGARITAVGHGGQVLVSEATARLAGGVALRDLGEHRLKDLSAPQRLYQLGDADFPPLRSLNATNLPVAATPLVGRADELAGLQALLRDGTRLVTLTGPGGSGKTRLALHAAAELADDFPGGVFFVGLAGVAEPELVAPTIRRAIGIHDFAELRDRRSLLVLDNFEHLLEGAPTAGEILASAPAVKVIATSRAPLRVEGEHEFAVEPLPEGDAIDLFAERARAVQGDFEPDADTLEICRRLDGLPLALELAAPRLRSLSTRALLARLENRLPLLTGGRRDAPERQRTLRTTIEWSVDLLERGLQATFARLGVFAGSFSLEAADAVARASFDEVDALVEASLLKRVGDDRFLMLETIRELAAERLDVSDEAEDVRRRHASYLTDLARRLGLSVESIAAGHPQRYDLAIPELNNFRAALDWAQATDPVLGLRLAVALENFWVTQGLSEGKSRVEALLERAEDVALPLRAASMRTIGSSAAMHGEGPAGAEGAYRESLALYRRAGDESGIALLEHRLGVTALHLGDWGRGRGLLDSALARARRLGARVIAGQALGSLAEVEHHEGNGEKALALALESAHLAREIGFRWWEGNMLEVAAEIAEDLGRNEEAMQFRRGALQLAHRIGDRLSIVCGLGALARAAARLGDAERAGRLWAAVEREEARAPLPAWEKYRGDFVHAVEAASGEDFERGRAGGRRLTIDAAVAEALADA